MKTVTDLSEQFEQLAATFVSNASSGVIALGEQLDRSKLDYSVESLQAVDGYLQRLHDADESAFSDEQYGNAVLWAAAYFGEVIRRNAKSKFGWMTYEEFAAALPAISKNVPPEETSKWVLCERSGPVFTPIGKVMRRVTRGGDRLYPFTVAVLKQGI